MKKTTTYITYRGNPGLYEPDARMTYTDEAGDEARTTLRFAFPSAFNVLVAESGQIGRRTECDPGGKVVIELFGAMERDGLIAALRAIAEDLETESREAEA